MLVSVDNRTRMHRILPESKCYGVSVLASEQEQPAMHFAGHRSNTQDDPFILADGVPVVREAIAHFVCDSYAVHEAGDHTLYIGQVREFATREGEPLLFHGGAFARMANDPMITSWGW